MTRVISELAERIGPRFSGSAGEHAAAEVLHREFKAAGLDPEYQAFSFIGWSATSKPHLQIIHPESKPIASAPLVYSAPANQLTGRVVAHGMKTLIQDLYEMYTYRVVDGEGAQIGQLIVNSRGEPMPLINPTPMIRLPQFVIDEATAAEIDEWLHTGQEVRVSMDFKSELDANAYSYNVIARYRGAPDTDEHVVVCAHYDTQIDSPGAYDNASGTAGMFGVLEHIQTNEVPMNVTFVAIAGEEVGMFGSQYYVTDLVERGILNDTKYCICLDQISGGEFFWLWCTDPDLRQTALDAIGKTAVATLGDVQVDDNKPGADHWAFHEKGVPACLLMWWRQEDYHLPSDTFEKVDMERVHAAVDSASNLLVSLGQGLSG